MLDGNVMVLDHEDIDIVFMEDKNKCITFPKREMSDKVYEAQDRMFEFMAKKGIVSPSTVRGGNVYGSMEAEILENKLPGVETIQVFLYVINEFISGEKPFFKTASQFEDDHLDALLRPSDEESTELGDVPQSDKKGSMDSRVRPYGFQYNYSLVREGESEDT